MPFSSCCLAVVGRRIALPAAARHSNGPTVAGGAKRVGNQDCRTMRFAPERKPGYIMQNVIYQLRSGDWLTNQRMVAYAWILLIWELLAFAFCVAGTHGLVVTLPHPSSSDFVSFYGAGRLAGWGTGWLAYDQVAHYAAEQQATEPGIAYNYFYYPPVFLLFCAIFAPLPYLCAFVAFQASFLAPCLLAVRAILRDTRLVFLLAFPAVFWAIGTGQNAFLTAALFAAATLNVDRRPLVAGLLFGALCY